MQLLSNMSAGAVPVGSCFRAQSFPVGLPALQLMTAYNKDA